MQGNHGIDIDRLMRQYGTLVMRQAYFYLKDRHKAEDVCQEVFLRMYKKQPQLPDEQSEKAYLLRVTINLCKDVLKSAWHRKVSPMIEGYDAPHPQGGPEADAVQNEEKQLLKLSKVLDSLKKRTKKNLGSLEISSQLLPETNWEESWKDNYPPQPMARSSSWSPAGIPRPTAASP